MDEIYKAGEEVSAMSEEELFSLMYNMLKKS